MRAWQAYRRVREKGYRGPWLATNYRERFAGVQNEYATYHKGKPLEAVSFLMGDFRKHPQF
jgi:hypothetical protein